MLPRFLAATLVVAMMVVGQAHAAESPVGASAVSCVGLTCADAGVPASVRDEIRWTARTVLGPGDLKTQKTAGYYEFGHGTTLGKTAVAYVIPAGQLDAVPQVVRNLQVVKDLSSSDFATGTVVVFSSGGALWIPTAQVAGMARATADKGKRRPRARAAADEYGCPDSYFCIYSATNFAGYRYQWHDISSSWTNLGDWGFNDNAESSRNRRDRDSWLAEHINGGGDRHCYDSHSSDADYGGWGNDASSTYNSAGDAGC